MVKELRKVTKSENGSVYIYIYIYIWPTTTYGKSIRPSHYSSF
jgi:hypothetical protein